MATYRDLKTIASIVPECDTEIATVANNIGEYERTLEKMTGKRLGDVMPEYFSHEAVIELNKIAYRIEGAIHSLHKCMSEKNSHKLKR